MASVVGGEVEMVEVVEGEEVVDGEVEGMMTVMIVELEGMVTAEGLQVAEVVSPLSAAER